VIEVGFEVVVVDEQDVGFAAEVPPCGEVALRGASEIQPSKNSWMSPWNSITGSMPCALASALRVPPTEDRRIA
jgi:hypothetical protein